MDITSFAIKNTRTSWVAIIGIALAGILTYFQLPRAEDPGFIIRVAQIMTIFPGASPERVEMLVTEPLEQVVKEMPELDFVSSTSKTGVSVIFVNIKESYKEMRPIWDRLRRKVDAVRPDLPEGIVGPTVNDEFGDVFGIIIALTGEGYSYAELEDVADDVRDELLRLPNAAKVEIVGAQEERIFVEYNNARLSESGLSPFQLSQILASRNIIIPGGSVEFGPERIALEPSGNFESLDDLRKTVINLPRGGVVFLQDVAEVTRGYIDPPRSKVHSGGGPALALAISLREGGNISDLGEEVTKKLEELQAIHPIGLEMEVVSFQPSIVNRKVDDFVSSLIQAIVIVLVVMLLTLGLRTGLVVASLIPTTMLASLVIMGQIHIGLDQISLASLIIALGMLVDNAIVMSESIMVQMEAGKPVREAAVDSAHELRVPLLVASLTTSASFLPIFLAKSMVGEYTASIFKVVTIALLSSWVLALTMTPLMCVLFLRIKKKEKSAASAAGHRLLGLYERGLRTLLKHRLATLAFTTVVFLGVMSLFPKVPFQFFPPADRPLMTVELRLPIGTKIEATEAAVERLEDFLADYRTTPQKPGIDNWVAFIGEGAPRFNLGYAPEPPSPDYAYVLVNTANSELIPELRGVVEDFLNSDFPDLSARVGVLNYGPPVRSPIAIRLSGKEIGPLFEIVDGIKAKLGQISGTKNIEDDWGLRSKKLEVNINQPRARRAGVSNQEIAVSLQTVLSGIETTQYREDDKTIPITLRSVSADRRDVGKVESLSVFSQASGRSVPLKQVADLELEFEPAKILRRDQLRTVTVSSQLDPGVSSRDVTSILVPWLEEEQAKHWPAGYRVKVGGEQEEAQKGNQSIVDQLPIAALIIILLLVGQFNSIRRAAIIAMTIPLGLIGVVLGLLGTGSYFGFMTFLGIVSLAGIVVNNAIVLLDRINLEVAAGSPPDRAVIDAARLRMRPILLTTATTVGGLLPLWFGGGKMFEPMAIAIIFGLMFSTMLTLGVVPVLYSLLFRISYR